MAVLPTGGAPFEAARLSRRGFMTAGIAGGLALASIFRAGGVRGC